MGHFNGEAWLSGDIQAGWSFWNKLGLGKALHYVAGMLQWGKVFGRETSYVGQYYMLNKIFVAADTPQGSFDSGMAALLDKSPEGEVGMYLVHLYSGETLQWPFKVVGQRAIPLPLAYHDDTPSYEDGWWEYCSRCFCVLLQMPEGDQVILPSQLMGISSLTKAVFETKWEYGQCCLLFRMGEPSHFVPLGMTNIKVFGSSALQSQTPMVSASAGTSGSKCSAESSTSRPQTSSHSGLIQMLSTGSSSFSQAAGTPAVQGSPGIPEDFEVQQPKSRSTKKRRINSGQSGGQTIDENRSWCSFSPCQEVGDGEHHG